ncbi:hypothetical protein HaLaN_12055 [Haematococcus lacustris]|uniref:Uncharacterized protein n=1 Tax=Haematococcus lacustris TaxID=44745 RepID=A0A699ZA96_HAELA|nr:hypothetical protein HaLaN_12055 [Haematococcus lacustris]
MDDDEEMAMRAMMAVSDPTLTAPPLASDAQAVVSEVVVGTPEDVFAVLLANDSHFLEDFLEAQGNSGTALRSSVVGDALRQW